MSLPIGEHIEWLLNPSTVTDPTDNNDGCPGCGAHDVQSKPAPPTVKAWTCTACGLDWAVTVVNPTVRIALDVVALLPTPQERTAAFLTVLRAEVAQRREHPVTTTTVCLPAGELFNLDPMASADAVIWRCRLCDCKGTARYRPAAHSDTVEHPDHRAPRHDRHRPRLKLRPAAG